MGRNKKYKTKAEKLAANRLASKKWYEENKNKKNNRERIGFNEEPIESINEYWEHNEDLILEKLMEYVLGEDK